MAGGDYRVRVIIRTIPIHGGDMRGARHHRVHV
ncbi:MAG: hypothetical protein RI985_1947, partial [Chloroflexota bacterium]